MKRHFVRQCMGLAVGLTLFGGCARPSAQTDQPRTIAGPTATVLPPATLVAEPAPLASGLPAAAAPRTLQTSPSPETAAGTNFVVTAPQGTNGPAIEQRIAPAQPANMSPGVDEVARLAQGGVSEEVMQAYIEKYPGRFNVSADQIVYLNDLGVSSGIVTAMLKHDGNTTTLAEPAAAASAVTQSQQVSNLPQAAAQTAGPPPQEAAPAPAAPPAAPQVVTPAATPPPSTDVAYFYDSLSPYGSWMYVSGYGWCWQPTVAVAVNTWQPYCDRGRWYWSDSGWYWHSDYSWGWAPFHYGRWYRHPGAGWIWTPGVVWGPSWVSWRYSDGYCGWAPLPPEAYWAPGVGFTYYGRHVSIGFDFGLSWHHYAFVSVGSFCDPHPYRHVIRGPRVVNVYQNTRVVNNYGHERNAVINRGVGRETIARHSAAGIREVKVQQTSFAAGSDRMSRLERRGNDIVAYRPELPKEPPVKPSVIHNRMNEDLRQNRVARNDVAPGSALAPRAGRGSVADGSSPVPGAGRGAATAPETDRNAPGRVERNAGSGRADGRPNAPQRVTPGVNRPERTVPSRVERSQPTASEQRNSTVARLNDTPANIPDTGTLAPRVERNENTSPRVERSQIPPRTQAPRPVYPEARTAPSVTPPAAAAPRVVQPSMSPRYSEQAPIGRVPSYSAPSYSAPARVSPGPTAPGYARPEYSAPSAPRAASRAEVAPGYSAPRNNGGAVERSGNAAGSRNGGGGGRGDGGGGREGRAERNR